MVCLEIQDHLEDLVHWYVGIDNFNNLALVVFEGIAHGCAGGKQIKRVEDTTIATATKTSLKK